MTRYQWLFWLFGLLDFVLCLIFGPPRKGICQGAPRNFTPVITDPEEVVGKVLRAALENKPVAGLP